MALSLSDEVSEEFFAEIRKIAKKYSSGFENELRGALSEQILNIRGFLESENLNEICTYVSVLPVFDFKSQPMNLMNRYLSAKLSDENIEELEKQLIEITYSIIFAYLTEYQLRILDLEQKGIYGIIENYLDIGRWKVNEFKYARDKIIYSSNHLIFKILDDKYKKSNLAKVDERIQSIDQFILKVDEWNESFELKKKAVLDLEKRLEESKQTYDFVLLVKGFNELYLQKQAELDKAKSTYGFVATTMFTIPFAEFIFLIYAYFYFNGNIPSALWLITIPFVTLILITLYLLKIALQDKRSIQSQMMQLELRMALCQFIHNYADDSEKLHKKNAAGFEKFENIIFSPLVSSDDKIPTTFDGMEQLAKLVSEFRK